MCFGGRCSLGRTLGIKNAFWSIAWERVRQNTDEVKRSHRDVSAVIFLNELDIGDNPKPSRKIQELWDDWCKKGFHNVHLDPTDHAMTIYYASRLTTKWISSYDSFRSLYSCIHF